MKKKTKMKRTALVAIFVLLLCALFLVLLSSAQVECVTIDDFSVSPHTGHLNDKFDYNITLTNNWLDMDCTIDLTIWPNKNNRGCFIDHSKDRRLRKSIKLEAGETIAILFNDISFGDISFLELKSCDEDYKKFAEGKSHWLWTNCHYQFEVFPGDYCNEVTPVEGDGPTLEYFLERFRYNETRQNNTYKDLSFDYSIEVQANKADSISLHVWNYSKGGWDDKELKEYTNRPDWQLLRWRSINLTHVNLDSDFNGRYKFVGSFNETPEYTGPSIEQNFLDPRVSYRGTIDELIYNYEVTARVNLVEDTNITLQVWNFETQKWESKGIQAYTTPGFDQQLRWHGITLSCAHFDNQLRGKYRFVGTYKVSSAIIGPIIEESFDTLEVVPREGRSDDTFTYRVTVNATISDIIELQVKNHTSGEWDPKGTRTYTELSKNKTLTWPNIQLNVHELSRSHDSVFKFVSVLCGNKSESLEKELPIWPIRPVLANLSVTPERGLYTDEFTYSVDVKAEKAGRVKLSVFCPDGGLVYEGFQEYTIPTEWQILNNWNIPSDVFNRCRNKEVTGYAHYGFEFWYKGNEIINQTEKGPYLGIATFDNGTVEPINGTLETLFNYSVQVKAIMVGKVELLLQCPGETQWTTLGEKEYDTTGIWKTLNWHKKLPCDSYGEAEFMFRFMPGFVESNNYTGPRIIKEDFGKLLVSPDKGTSYTEFNFSVPFSGSVEEDLTLQVLNSSSKKWENVATEDYIPPETTTISFANIRCPETLVTQWSDERFIQWRVKGSISNSSIALTYWDIELRWYNSSISLKEGWWNDPFAFSVNLSANLDGDVELQIRYDDSGNDSWNTVGERKKYSRPDPQILRWENERICTESYEGNISYRFVFYWRGLSYPPSPTYPGPEVFIPLNISFRDAFVKPEEGVSYHFGDYIFNSTTNTTFNFSVTLTADKNTSLQLALVGPDGNFYPLPERCKYTTPHVPLTCTWEGIELPSGQIGMWNFTALYYDSRYGLKNRTFEGPKLVAVFEEYTISPEKVPYGDSCNVTVCVNGLEKMDVTLEAFNLINKRWEGIGTEHYEPVGLDCLSWIINTLEVPFDNLRLLSGDISSVSGGNEAVAGSVTVPAVKNASVSPTVGNVTDSFNYSLDVRFYEETVIELQIFHPLENAWKAYGKRRYTGNRDWQTLWWDETSLGPAWEGEDVKYKFSWQGIDLVFAEGPYITPELAWQFKDAIVKPITGSYNDKFAYSVSVKVNKEEEVGLETFNISSYKWAEQGEKQRYNNIGDWQLMSWPEVTYIASAESEGLASYRFFFIDNESRERCESGTYYGPTLRPTAPVEKFKNATVYPDWGYYTTPFNYSVEVSRSEDVELTIYDISTDEWVPKGKGIREGNRWKWKDVKFRKDCAGIASFQFKAGANVSKIYYGPTLKKVPGAEGIFSNAAVKPATGNFSTSFNYSVEINKSLEVSSVRLEVYNGTWHSEGEGQKSDGYRWEWLNIRFGEGDEGIAKYKFVCNDRYESSVYDGPLLFTPVVIVRSTGGGGGGGGSYSKPYMLYKNADVEPDLVQIGVIERKPFNYSVEVDKDDPLILEIYNLSSMEWEEKGKGEKHKLKTTWRYEWTVNLTLDQDWAGYGKYRFYPEKKAQYASQVYYGPEIKTESLSEWKQEIGFSDKVLKAPEITCTVTPLEDKWFKKFTYTANITHPDKARMTVALFVYKPESGEWKPVPWRGYSYNPIIDPSDYDKRNTATVQWTVEEKEVFDEEDAGKGSGFYIWYWDGYNEYKESQGNFYGPELLFNRDPRFVRAFPPIPENGSTHCVYEYKFEVIDPDNDTVHGLLTVIDPMGEERKFKEDPGKKGYVKFTVGPDQLVFTEEKLREYINETGNTVFTSRYQLEYWDEGMAVMGETNSTEWFVGPHVTLVNVHCEVSPLNPNHGTYDDEFEYMAGFSSSKDNTFWLNLTIYDPSNPEHAHQILTTKNLSVATDTIVYVTWRVKPDVFGPDDFGKIARYRIAWKDQYGNKGIINGTGPYIERAVPLVSLDPPLVPLVSIVTVPASVFILSILLVLLNLRGKLRWWRKQRIKERGE